MSRMPRFRQGKDEKAGIGFIGSNGPRGAAWTAGALFRSLALPRKDLAFEDAGGRGEAARGVVDLVPANPMNLAAVIRPIACSCRAMRDTSRSGERTARASQSRVRSRIREVGRNDSDRGEHRRHVERRFSCISAPMP